ncbi:hypothetical protein D3C84_1069770 [compost metagenome]
MTQATFIQVDLRVAGSLRRRFESQENCLSIAHAGLQSFQPDKPFQLFVLQAFQPSLDTRNMCERLVAADDVDLELIAFFLRKWR